MFFLNNGRRRRRIRGATGSSERLPCIRSYLIHVAGHELDLRVGERRAAAVRHRDPADKVDGIGVLGRDHIVARLPGQAAGDVGKFRIEFRGRVAVDLPGEGGLQDRVITKSRKARFAGQGELQFSVHFDDRLRALHRVQPGNWVWSRHKSAADDFPHHDAIRFVRLLRDEYQRLAFK